MTSTQKYEISVSPSAMHRKPPIHPSTTLQSSIPETPSSSYTNSSIGGHSLTSADARAPSPHLTRSAVLTTISDGRGGGSDGITTAGLSYSGADSSLYFKPTISSTTGASKPLLSSFSTGAALSYRPPPHYSHEIPQSSTPSPYSTSSLEHNATAPQLPLPTILLQLHAYLEAAAGAAQSQPASNGTEGNNTAIFSASISPRLTAKHNSIPNSSTDASDIPNDLMRNIRFLIAKLGSAGGPTPMDMVLQNHNNLPSRSTTSSTSNFTSARAGGDTSTLPSAAAAALSGGGGGGLDRERELSLQVGVLMEQVEAQSLTIKDLETELSHKKERLAEVEAKCQMSSSFNSTSALSSSAHNLFSSANPQSGVNPTSVTSNGSTTLYNGGGDLNHFDFTAEEVLSRTSVEAHKFDLMAEISGLKLKLATADKEKIEMQERMQKAQEQIGQLHVRLSEKDYDLSELRSRLRQQQDQLTNHSSTGSGTIHSTPFVSAEAETEVDTMKRMVATLMDSNTLKDKKIGELKNTIKRYKRIEELVLGNSKPLTAIPNSLPPGISSATGGGGGGNEDLSDSSSTRSAKGDLHSLEKQLGAPPGFLPPADQQQGSQTLPHQIKTPTDVNGRAQGQPLASSTPEGSNEHHQHFQQQQQFSTASLPASARMLAATFSSAVAGAPLSNGGPGGSSGSGTALHTASYEEIGGVSRHSHKAPQRTGGGLSTPPTTARHNQSGSLGGATAVTGLEKKKSRSSSSSGGRTRPVSSSAVNEEDEFSSEDEAAAAGRPDGQTTAHMELEIHEKPPREERKKKGKFRFFNRKLRRSNSQEIDPADEAHSSAANAAGESGGGTNFKRGGVRATAGPRVNGAGTGGGGHASRAFTPNIKNLPFSRWSTEHVASWFEEMGLGIYSSSIRRWLRSGGGGSQLLHASLYDFEKELGMKNSLHRKKLDLALRYLTVEGSEAAALSRLDHLWVVRWLDDIGLAQYKDTFIENRVDGRMLNFMTVDDLLQLRVQSDLHHASIRRGIQLLRLHNFDPQCLRRRPLTANDIGSSSSLSTGGAAAVPPAAVLAAGSDEVMLWSNHRVMEWLRSIDLSEYAPNLRGSGIHGALIILEPRFSLENFASILSIPSAKTLLRRHLSAKFIELIGPDTQRQKREAELQPGFTPLTPNTKIKAKRGLFAQRRSKSDNTAAVDEKGENFLCPPPPPSSLNGGSSLISSTSGRDREGSGSGGGPSSSRGASSQGPKKVQIRETSGTTPVRRSVKPREFRQ